MAVKAVIFDLDGTLYDNSGLILRLVLRSLRHLDLIWAERVARRSLAGKHVKGPVYDELFHNMAELTHSDASRARKWFYDVYMPLQANTLMLHYHAKPWVISTLKALKSKGISVACLSDYGAVNEKLRAVGIDPALFDVVMDAPTAGGVKPCPDPFLNVARMLGTDPADTLVVGDRQDTDAMGAAAAGMQFLQVPRYDTQTIDIDQYL